MPIRRIAHRDAARFGAVLQRLRVARGWSILTAAQRCGMNPNYLGSLEKGRNMPSVETLLEAADAYGVNASDIMREVEELRRRDRQTRADAVTANEPAQS